MIPPLFDDYLYLVKGLNPISSLLRFSRLPLQAAGIFMLLCAAAVAQQLTNTSKSGVVSAETLSDNHATTAIIARTESPRQTLSSLIRLRDELERAAISYFQKTDSSRSEYLGTVGEHLTSLIDFSAVPSALRRQVSRETTGYLLDILGRIEIPDLDTVPNAEAYEEGEPASYLIPKTPLRIVRVNDGPRVGEFLFSGRTVEVAPRFYAGIQSIPLRSTLPIESWSKELPQIAGPIIPVAAISALPVSLKALYLDTPIWKIIAVIFISLLVTSVLVLWRRMIVARDESMSRMVRDLSGIASSVIVLVIIIILLNFFQTQISVSGRFAKIVDFTFTVLFYLTAIWVFWRAVLVFFEAVIVGPKFSEESVDANMVRLIAQIVGVAGGVVILAYGAQQMGIPIYSMLAGLGIGGLAIALAIRPTLENLIGGFILYIDKPIRVGDYCEFGDQGGSVETIGIRSTQIRSLDRTLISIPNAQFADMQIINWARCDQMMITHTVGLRYETEADQLRYVLAKIREMFHAHPRIDSDTVRVRFDGYGASSLDVAIRVYAKTREWNDYFAIKEDVFLRIYDIVKQSGTGFAFPSQTLYMGKDDGLDEQLGNKAKQQVAQWRRTREFPFPKFATSKLEQLAGPIESPIEIEEGALEAIQRTTIFVCMEFFDN